jgi:hypothetical protein
MRPALAALAVLALAVPADAYVAENRLVVEPTGPSSFTVPYRGLAGASDFWCAAGDYVIASLGLPPTTRIWRTSAPPRRSGQGISFALTPEGAAETGLAILGGNSLTAAHAEALCHPPGPLRLL